MNFEFFNFYVLRDCAGHVLILHSEKYVSNFMLLTNTFLL